ncbi:hypothetical protein LG293_17755 (plasmid) [Citricoccus nitrophenolicus]
MTSSPINIVSSGFADFNFIDTARAFKVATVLKQYADQLRTEHSTATRIQPSISTDHQSAWIEDITWYAGADDHRGHGHEDFRDLIGGYADEVRSLCRQVDSDWYELELDVVDANYEQAQVAYAQALDTAVRTLPQLDR